MMKLIGVFTLSILAFSALTAVSQPPDDKDKGPDKKKGPPPFDKKGPPPYEPGRLMPPHVRELLELTEDQEKKLADLEKETRAKLMTILTAEQKQRLQELRDKGPKGPPKDKDGPPEKKKKDKDKGPDNER